MLFTTLDFIFIFLPMVLILYFILKRKYRNVLLFTVSLIFYYLGAKIYILLLLTLILYAFFMGNMLEKTKNKKRKKIILACMIGSVLMILCAYKYNSFILNNINSFFHQEIKIIKLLLPLGISFYTFQIISYFIDIYRGGKAHKNIIELGLYLSFFPQLIAGPIVRYQDIKEDLKEKNRKIDFNNIEEGLWRFSIGLCKKVLLANQLANISSIVFTSKEIGTYSMMYAWLGAISFALQIYYDFSGYSDMAIGLARIFGFHIKENFNYPYSAKTIRDFWKKWHISLSSFFKDYIYIPLGGNKCKKIIYIRNIMIVWFLTGLWHGASWNYILWGILYGIIIIIESFIKEKEDSKIIVFLRRIITLMIIIILWTIFNTKDLFSAGKYIMSMFGIGTNGMIDKAFIFQFTNSKYLLLVSIVLSFPIVPKLQKKYQNKKFYQYITTILLLIGVLISISTIVMEGYNPFLYFIF